jgi:hypothetical protein
MLFLNYKLLLFGTCLDSQFFMLLRKFCFISRQEVIERLQNQHSLVILVTNSLTSYMDKVRHIAKGMVCSHFLLLYDKHFE